MQRASGPRLSITLPDGKVTEVRAMAAGLWQVVQLNVPAGAGTTAVTLPLAAKSWNPWEEWHLAQFAGMTAAAPACAGVFQWLKASALASAWADPKKLSKNGTSSVGCGTAVSVAAAVGTALGAQATST